MVAALSDAELLAKPTLLNAGEWFEVKCLLLPACVAKEVP